MPTAKDQAICIRHWDWSETSQTVSLFTAEHGIVRGLAKGSRRENAPFSGGIELLTRAEAMFILKNTSSESNALATLTAWDLQEPYSGLRRSLKPLHTAMFFADLVHHSLHEFDTHPMLFRGFASALGRLERGDPPLPITAEFLWLILAETGYRPQVLVDVRTGEELPAMAIYQFSPQLGGLVGGLVVGDKVRELGVSTPAPARGASIPAASGAHEVWKARPDTVEVLRTLARWGESVDSPGPLADTSASDEAILRSCALLASYFRFIHQVWPPSIRWILPDRLQQPPGPPGAGSGRPAKGRR